MKCKEKLCLHSALLDEETCAAHLPQEKIKQAPAKEFEIVSASDIPAFEIRNERTKRAIAAFRVLQPGNALKIAVPDAAAKCLTANIAAVLRKLKISYIKITRQGFTWFKKPAK